MDEVAAQHVDADAMVHYGHACMSLYVSVPIIPRLFGLFCGRTSRLPVIYVFGKKTVDVDLCVKQLVEAFDVDVTDGNDVQKNAILLKHDVVFTHQAGISLSSFSLLSRQLTRVIIYRCNYRKTSPISRSPQHPYPLPQNPHQNHAYTYQ